MKPFLVFPQRNNGLSNSKCGNNNLSFNHQGFETSKKTPGKQNNCVGDNGGIPYHVNKVVNKKPSATDIDDSCAPDDVGIPNEVDVYNNYLKLLLKIHLLF